MTAVPISQWKYGLDTRRSQLTSVPGTLLEIDNAHINQGAEVEKRKAFVKTLMPPQTFGAQPTPTTIYVFGSSSGIGVPNGFTYQQLQAPSGAPMTGVIASTLFGNIPFVVASFSDGNTYAFYNGVLVSDFISGLASVQFNTNALIAQGLTALVNATKVYTAVYNSASHGVNTFDTFSIPNTSGGNPYTPAITVTSVNGTVVDALVSTGSAATGVGTDMTSFSIVAGADNVHATGTLTASTTVNNGDQVVVGSITYSYVTALAGGGTANQILIGTQDGSLTNLAAAINGTAGAGTIYGTGTVANTKATSGAVIAHAIIVIAINAGTPGNSVAASTTATGRLAWSGLAGGNLSGGTNVNYISAVNVGVLNLLSGNVPFNQTINQTASDIAANIAANGGTGWTATATQNGVNCVTTTNTDTYANDVVETVVSGAICCGQCNFSLQGTGFTVNSIDIGSTALMTAPVTYATSLPAIAAALVANINANSGSSGYTSSFIPNTGTIYLAATTTKNTDLPASVDINATAGSISGGGASSLVALLTTANIVATEYFSTYPISFSTTGIGVTVTGGVPPYTYLWKLITISVSPTFMFPCSAPPVAGRASTISYTATIVYFQVSYVTNVGQSPPTGPQTATWVCQVTDAANNVSTSPPVVVTWSD
jgi:hypothetical protein